MPFTESGIVPDIIMNPHAIPSRMTISQLIESVTGKVCAIKGTMRDATAFRPISIDQICDELESLGFDKYGEETLYNGFTGARIKSKIFIGMTYYQRLQKFVEDEKHAIDQGPTCQITRQPLEGRSRSGGLRIGEMEKDVIIAHGSMSYWAEKMLDHSDRFIVYICRKCGQFATAVNEDRAIYKCNICEDKADIVEIRTGYSNKLLLQKMQSCNIGMCFGIEPHTYTSNK